MACNRSRGTSMPRTAAVCSSRFSSGGSRSMRAARTACTVAGILQGLVQGQHLAGDLGPDGTRIVVLLHMAVTPEQVNDREIGGRLAVGDRGAFKDQPPRCVVGVDALVGRAGLARTSLANQREQLRMARESLVHDVVH